MTANRTWMFAVIGIAMFGNLRPTSGVTLIDTISTWDGTSQVNGFGDPDTSYFGQSFIALDSGIESISFLLDGRDWQGAPYATEFHLLLTPLASTGDRPDFDNILFESGDLATTLDSDFEQFDIELQAPVVPGNAYIWVLDAFVLQDEYSGIAAVALNNGSYDGGQFLFWNTGPFDPGVRADHDDQAWHTWVPNGDLAFSVAFTPEPESGLIVALSFLFLLRRFHIVR